MSEPLVYFGVKWDVPFLRDGAHRIDTPVGDVCLYCEEPIRLGDQGVMRAHVHRHSGDWKSDLVPLHRECDLRMTLGGINHLQKECGCFGGFLDADPPGLSKREASKLVLDWVTKTRVGAE